MRDFTNKLIDDLWLLRQSTMGYVGDFSSTQMLRYIGPEGRPFPEALESVFFVYEFVVETSSY